MKEQTEKKDVKSNKEIKTLATLNRRLIAIILDSISLGIFGFLIVLVFENVLYGHPTVGKVIGFIITAVYFALMDSKLCKGQSLGKMATKIQVVDNNGEHISIVRALSRVVILEIPFVLNGMQLPYNLAMNPIIMNIVSIIVFGGIITILYFFMVNRKTKQSIHDMATSTYVVNVRAENKVVEGKVPLFHYGILALILTTVFYFGLNEFKKIGEKYDFSELLKLKTAVENQTKFNVTDVNEHTFTGINYKGKTGNKKVIIKITVMPRVKKDSYKEYSKVIFDAVRKNYNLNSIDEIQVIFVRAIDIGIYCRFRSKGPLFSAEKDRAFRSKGPLACPSLT